MTTMHKLAGLVLTTLAVLGTGQPQSSTEDLHVRDIKAQQPLEKILASAPCRQVRDSQKDTLFQRVAVDPKALVADLDTLMQKSDEVVLAGISLNDAPVLSPSGQGVTTYYDVKVLRSWKGPHEVGDTLTFGVPAGSVHCGPSGSHYASSFASMIGTPDWNGHGRFGPYVLFLRHPRGNEIELVQGGLLPAAGAGLQGIFPIQLPPKSKAAGHCNAALDGTVQWCGEYLETSSDPVVVPYAHDPLAKNYDGMPISEFLHEVRSVANSQGLAER